MKMIRRVYHATEVDPPQKPGWYYHYEVPTSDPLEATAGEEYGPFETRDEAVDHACASQPANWQVTDESELDERRLSLDDFDSLPGESHLRNLGRVPTYREAYEAHGTDWSSPTE